MQNNKPDLAKKLDQGLARRRSPPLPRIRPFISPPKKIQFSKHRSTSTLRSSIKKESFDLCVKRSKSEMFLKRLNNANRIHRQDRSELDLETLLETNLPN